MLLSSLFDDFKMMLLFCLRRYVFTNQELNLNHKKGKYNADNLKSK